MISLPSVSQIADLIKAGATIEAREQVMRLREAALEQQEENLKLMQRLREAQGTIKELEQKLAKRAALRHVAPVYYAEGDDVPFCPICIETHERRTHLFLHELFGGGLSGECKVCKQSFAIRPSPNGSATMETVPLRRSDRLAGL